MLTPLARQTVRRMLSQMGVAAKRMTFTRVVARTDISYAQHGRDDCYHNGD